MDTKLNEKIVKVGNKWQVQSEKGRNMGTYDTKEEAEKRLKQVHYFKHLNESNNDYREKGLQIYYWLEDKGLNVDYSDWGETFYYSFGDEQDYNNAVILLNEYSPNSIIDTDSNRLEIRVDIPTAYEKIKDGVNKYYLGEDYEEDAITEQLMESNSVEDNLDEIIRATLATTKDDYNIHLFEADNNKNNIIDFDDGKIDFNKLTIYPYDEEKPYAPVASFMLSGGLNGSGTWTDYLDDLQKVFDTLKEETLLEPLLYEEETDIADDLWYAKVLMYNTNEEDTSEKVDEGLFTASPAFITLQLGDTITTPIDYHNSENDYILADDTYYEVIQLDDGKYTFEYENLDHPNVSGGSGIVSDWDGIEYDSLQDLTNEYYKELSENQYMINRDDPYDSYEMDSKEKPLEEDMIDETYSKDELDKLRNKIFNQRKIMSIYRKKKYGKKRLMCRTKCVNCGREKKLFLSNLITNPEKYGSCICSDKNIESRFDIIHGLYKGTRRLRNNTSGYTGVSWVSTYAGEPYNKWRAYIDIDGQRNYLGDFSSKSKAIRARKAAAAKGIKWYNDNKNEFMATSRRHRKRNRRLKTKRSTSNN